MGLNTNTTNVIKYFKENKLLGYFIQQIKIQKELFKYLHTNWYLNVQYVSERKDENEQNVINFIVEI